jgi:hypothetical protein
MGNCIIKLKSFYNSIMEKYTGIPDDLEKGEMKIISQNSISKSERENFSDIRPDVNMAVNKDMVADHSSTKDDVKEISTSKLQKMDIFERLEYRFPFYKMDVNGFTLHVKEAMKMYQPEKILI